jgi:hypothetical protein
MSQTRPDAGVPGRKRGWKRAVLAGLAVFLFYLSLALIGVVPEAGAWAAIWMPFAALAGWLAYRGTI